MEESTNVKPDIFEFVPEVEEVQQVLHTYYPDGWDRCWELGLTPWDLGGPTPIVLHLIQTGALPKGRVLVPGCGAGHDVVAMACPERYVVGVDISENAVKHAVKQISLSSPNANCTFLQADFYTWRPTEPFDVIFDYTFFSTIDPSLRSLWAKRMDELLKEDGELITLIFPINKHPGGPPFEVSVSIYEELLVPLGLKAVSIVDNNLSVDSRKGAEKLARWKRSLGQS